MYVQSGSYLFKKRPKRKPNKEANTAYERHLNVLDYFQMVALERSRRDPFTDALLRSICTFLNEKISFDISPRGCVIIMRVIRFTRTIFELRTYRVCCCYLCYVTILYCSRY